MGIGENKAPFVDGNRIFLDPPQWDDISASLIASRLDTVSGRLEYDFFNSGVSFKSTARYPDEPVVISLQMFHAMKTGAGAVLRPHIHWLQQQADIPNFMIGVKLINWGETTTFETDFSNYTLHTPTGNAFTYTAGVLAQITMFPEIDISSLGLSGTVNIALFRDSANTSTLFAGVDPVATDVTVVYTDAHTQFNSLGSREEYVK